MLSLFKEITENIEEIQLSFNSKVIIKRIITELREGIKNHNYEYTQLTKLPKGEMWSNIPLCFRNKIKNELHFYDKITTVIRNEYTFHIHFVNNTKLSIKYLNEKLKFIISWLNFIVKYKICINKTINLFIYLLNEPKNLPNEPDIIGIKNCNTAFTQSCGKEINIFRKEEWFKVFIHETFHTFGYDKWLYSPTLSIMFLNNILINIRKENILDELNNLYGNIHIFETYCEQWAEIIHCIYCSNSILDFEYRLSFQCKFSLFQCEKILKFQKLQYQDLILPNHSVTNYRENTCILSYFVLKSISSYFISDFIELFNPFMRQPDFQRFFLFFKERYMNKTLLYRFNEIDYILMRLNKNNILYKTLRMTLYDCSKIEN